MMWGYPYGGGGFGWIAMTVSMLFGLLVLVGIVLIIVWAVRAGSRHPQEGPGPYYRQHHEQFGQQQYGQQRDAAVDAARERYARGEITKEELDEIVRNLGYRV